MSRNGQQSIWRQYLQKSYQWSVRGARFLQAERIQGVISDIYHKNTKNSNILLVCRPSTYEVDNNRFGSLDEERYWILFFELMSLKVTVK